MVNQRSRKPGRKAPPRVQDIAAGKPAPDHGSPPAPVDDDATSVGDAPEPGDRSAEPGEDPSSDGATDRGIEPAPSSDDDATTSDTGERTGEPLAGTTVDGATPDSDPSTRQDPDDATTGDDEGTDPADGARSDARDGDATMPAVPDGDTAPADPDDADAADRAALDPDATEATGSAGQDAVDADEEPVADAPDLDPDDPLAAALAGFDAPRPAPPGVQLSDEIPIDPEDDLRTVEGEASLRLVSILESLLFAAAKPLRVQDLRKVLAETSKHQIQLALKHLMHATAERGVVLAQVAGGFQFRTHPDNAVWVQKMLQSKPARLSRTQIETLAIVAYRQPITRPEIDNVRGVDSGAVLKTLLERELIQIVGKKEEPGRPLLYGTTVRFLEFFNLRGLRDLPTLRDFRDLSEESKATLRAKLGESEAEAMGQGVLGLDAEDGAKDMSEETADGGDEPVADTAALADPGAAARDPDDAAREPAEDAGDAHTTDDASADDATSTDEASADDATPTDGGTPDPATETPADDAPTDVEVSDPETEAPTDAPTDVDVPDPTDPDVPDPETNASTDAPTDGDPETDAPPTDGDGDASADDAPPAGVAVHDLETEAPPDDAPEPAIDDALADPVPPIEATDGAVPDPASDDVPAADRERTPGDSVTQVTDREDMSGLADRPPGLAGSGPAASADEPRPPVTDAPGDPFVDDPPDSGGAPSPAPGVTDEPAPAPGPDPDESLPIDDVER